MRNISSFGAFSQSFVIVESLAEPALTFKSRVIKMSVFISSLIYSFINLFIQLHSANDCFFLVKAIAIAVCNLQESQGLLRFGVAFSVGRSGQIPKFWCCFSTTEFLLGT